jgi:hypothetical protein
MCSADLNPNLNPAAVAATDSVTVTTGESPEVVPPGDRAP